MKFERHENEGEFHLIWRVYSNFDKGGKLENHEEPAKICNELLKVDYDESRHRKLYEGFMKFWREVRHEYVTEESLLERFDEIDIKQNELYKQQVKTRDQKREYRQLLRDDARIEHIVDVIQESLLDMPEFKFESFDNIEFGESTGILRVSDWHYGKQIDNIVNCFNKEVAKKRVDKLIFDTIKYCKAMNIGELYVANLGDMIEGNLRVTARVTQEEDIIQQIMHVSELLAYMLNTLSEVGIVVNYVSVLDNHSRANVNFRDHIEKENFGLLTDWYLEGRLSNSVNFISSKLDDNIAMVEIDGNTHWFVHGHLKAHAINSIVQNLTALLGIKPDYIHCGHWHSAQTKEFMFSKVLINGSLSGVDDYAFNSGFFSKPSQSLILIDGLNDLRMDINFS